jgi:hypothetical protein
MGMRGISSRRIFWPRKQKRRRPDSPPFIVLIIRTGSAVGGCQSRVVTRAIGCRSFAAGSFGRLLAARTTAATRCCGLFLGRLCGLGRAAVSFRRRFRLRLIDGLGL